MKNDKKTSGEGKRQTAEAKYFRRNKEREVEMLRGGAFERKKRRVPGELKTKMAALNQQKKN